MIKIPPPGSLIPEIDIINAPYPIHKMRSRCLNCSDHDAWDCFGCLIGRPCEYPLVVCKTEDREVLK